MHILQEIPKSMIFQISERNEYVRKGKIGNTMLGIIPVILLKT